MKFNVPFIPDRRYAGFLHGLGDRLFAVHYSLCHPALCDARVRIRAADVREMIRLLQNLPAAKKYLLANGRFHPDGNYMDAGALRDLIQEIERLYASRALDGIVFADAYFLRALSDAAPDLAERIEAVPSVNFIIDSPEKLGAIFDIVHRTRFQPPGKISVDRELNRRPDELAELAAGIRALWPGVQIELLANEGCLNHCAFRQTHEALIAAANTGTGIDTFRVNRDLGCRRLLTESPHRILSSPFIRPEDRHRYDGVADILKICGRTLGRTFLTRAVDAYDKESYKGNLLDLLDASGWMAEHWEIENDRLPIDFLDRITACEQRCAGCGICRDLFRRHAGRRPFAMADLRVKPNSRRRPER